MTGEEFMHRRGEVIRMTRLGYTAARIGHILGITERSVQRHRKAAGIQGPQAVPIPTDKLAFALELLKDGAPYGEVARTIGCTTAPLRKHFPGYGWPVGSGIELRNGMRKLKEISA